MFEITINNSSYFELKQTEPHGVDSFFRWVREYIGMSYAELFSRKEYCADLPLDFLGVMEHEGYKEYEEKCKNKFAKYDSHDFAVYSCTKESSSKFIRLYNAKLKEDKALLQINKLITSRGISILPATIHDENFLSPWRAIDQKRLGFKSYITITYNELKNRAVSVFNVSNVADNFANDFERKPIIGCFLTPTK